MIECVTIMLVLVFTCQSSSCFISDCPPRQSSLRDSKRMLVKFKNNRHPIGHLGQRSIRKPNYGASEFGGKNQKRDLRFLYNIFYNHTAEKERKSLVRSCYNSGCSPTPKHIDFQVLIQRWPWLFGALPKTATL